MYAVTKRLRLVAGSFSREAQAQLTKRRVRLDVVANAVVGAQVCYVYTTTIEAPDKAAASRAADTELLEIIAPYSIQANVYDTRVEEQSP